MATDAASPRSDPPSNHTRIRPRSFTLQWHLTERCNLQCLHCYQESFESPGLSFSRWLDVLDQWDRLVAEEGCPGQAGVQPPTFLNLTGGEPLLHPDFFRLLHALVSRGPRYRIGILTNGHLIDAPMARRLASYRPEFVQVSLEGTRATHDLIRGTDSHRAVTTAIRNLRRERIRVLVAFTAHRANFREFPQVAQIASDLGVTRVWADRFVPAGRALSGDLEPLNPMETREFMGLIRHARDMASRRWFHPTEVAQHRALQFLTGHGRPYRCRAGESLLALLPNGDVVPCRRMPIRVGNVLERPLVTLYRSHPLLQALRDPSRPVDGCEPCPLQRACRGGLRCLSWAMHGTPFHADPGCWLAHPSSPHSGVGNASPPPSDLTENGRDPILRPQWPEVRGLSQANSFPYRPAKSASSHGGRESSTEPFSSWSPLR